MGSSQGGQLVQGGEGIAHVLPPGEQLVQYLGVGAGGGVEQDDGPAVDAGEELGEGLVGGGLVVHIPVHIGQTPEDGLIAQGLGLL